MVNVIYQKKLIRLTRLLVSMKSFGVKLMFDISNELSTKTIKRLYYYIVNRFFYF